MSGPGGGAGARLVLGLTRQQRVRSRRDFLAVQNGGIRVTTPHFVLLLQARAANATGPGRLGITASKQVGNAVARNRSKRLVREAFRLDPGLIPAGIDLVVIVRSGTPELVLSQVQAEWAAVRGLVVKRAAALMRRGEIVR